MTKAVEAKRPFQEGDRGYRDALIWYGILNDVASKDEETYLVSDNKRDFADDKGVLHPDLRADLEYAGLEGQVTYMSDLQTFVESVVKPALEEVPSPLTEEAFSAIFEDHLETIIEGTSVAVERAGLPGLPFELFESEPYIEQLGLASAEVKDAYALDDASYYTALDVFVEASFLQTVYGPDAIWIAETWDMGITGGDEKASELSFTLTLPLRVSVVTSTKEGVEPEISVELNEFFGFCRHCHHPVVSDAATQCSGCGRALY